MEKKKGIVIFYHLEPVIQVTMGLYRPIHPDSYERRQAQLHSSPKDDMALCPVRLRQLAFKAGEELEYVVVNGKAFILELGAVPPPSIDVPANWEHAKIIRDKWNADKESYAEPVWDWDCHFKLNFDGPLVRISSRFYPGTPWTGDVSLFVFDKEVGHKAFKAATMEELNIRVEAFVESLRKPMLEIITTSVMLRGAFNMVGAIKPISNERE